MTRLSRAGGTRKKPVRYAAPSSHPSELLAAGLRAHRKGHSAEALARYQEHLQQWPDCLDALMNVGALHAHGGRAREALLCFERALDLAPEDGRVFRDVGLGLKTIGRLEEATRALDRAVAFSPQLVGGWLHLALLRLEVADRVSALEAAQAAVRLEPSDPSAHFVLARCVFDGRAPGASLEALARAQETPQGHAEAAVFAWLIRHHSLRQESAGEARLPRPGLPITPTELVELKQAVARSPRLRDLADAAVYLIQCMSGARLFSSARETLRYAASIAPAHGPTLELGVFHGVSLRWLSQCRPGPLHGFDSFLGLPDDWKNVPEGRFTTVGRAPEEVDARFWVGSFEEQLPLYSMQHPEPIALLHVDSDLYESARCGLEHLSPQLVAGSVIVFDEYFGHRGWQQDEHRAFLEAVEANGWSYDAMAANPFTGQAVMRLK